MSLRPLSVGELAVHFGLEPADVEWLLYEYATGTPWPELVHEIQSLDCTREEAECLAAHIRGLATNPSSVVMLPTAGPRDSTEQDLQFPASGACQAD